MTRGSFPMFRDRWSCLELQTKPIVTAYFATA